jgi:hypothetical protein
MHSRWPNRLTCDPLGRADTSARHICCRLSALQSFADILMHSSEPPLWVRLDKVQTEQMFPLYPDKRTLLESTRTSG